MTQIETGYTFSTNDGIPSRTDSHSYPEAMLRQGLFRDWFEFRIAYNAASVRNGGITVHGSQDVYLAAMLGVTAQRRYLPEIALIAQATVDTGSAAFTNGDDLLGLNVIYSWSVTDKVGVSGSTQMNQTVDGQTARQYDKWAQSLVLTRSHSESLGTYFEWYGLFPNGADSDGVEHYIDGGMTLLLSPDVQWDARVGMGLNQRSQDFFAGTGLSLRFR